MGVQADIHLQVMWNRLLAVVEEQAQTLVRTAFSTSAREAGDISAGVFDHQGRMLAQAVTGTPGHVNCMALSVRHFLERFPVDQMKEGDCYITNDPWKGSGHLHDFTALSPTFRDGRVVAMFASTSHVVDIGGIGLSPESKQIYFEGLQVPICHFAEAGVVNELLIKIIRQNVREPLQVEGDLYALSACNEVGSRRLREMMDEFGIDAIDDLAEMIIQNTRAAMREAIDRLPGTTARNSMRIDGFNAPVDLVAALTVRDGIVHVDYSGTSPVSDFGINCPKCYTDAYTSFAVKCIVAPDLPNNAGSLELVEVSAPEGSIVNAPYPSAVAIRALIGHMLPDVVFGCIDQLVENRVPAEGTSSLWNLRLGGGRGLSPAGGTAGHSSPFMVMSFHGGGCGARPTIDGLSATPFPSGVRNIAVEITEAISPVVVWRKELREDSGGPGRYRGGLGQVLIAGTREDAPIVAFETYDRIKHPARGRQGGGNGARGQVGLEFGGAFNGKGMHTIPPGDRLVLRMPGGGGFGDAFTRSAFSVADDVRQGYVSREAAMRDYGVVLDDAFGVDAEKTSATRAAGRTAREDWEEQAR